MSASRIPQLDFGKGEDDKELNNSNVQAHIQARSKSPAGAPDFVAGDGELTIQVEPGEDVEFVINVEEQSGPPPSNNYRWILLGALGYIVFMHRSRICRWLKYLFSIGGALGGGSGGGGCEVKCRGVNISAMPYGTIVDTSYYLVPSPRRCVNPCMPCRPC